MFDFVFDVFSIQTGWKQQEMNHFTGIKQKQSNNTALWPPILLDDVSIMKMNI